MQVRSSAAALTPSEARSEREAREALEAKKRAEEDPVVAASGSEGAGAAGPSPHASVSAMEAVRKRAAEAGMSLHP
jgi:pyruvate/2-oxoglutarate dehydrogenase complex dihydrolipoamide acyltransferase (E2) component